MPITTPEYLALLVLGLVAGVLGGLVGLGGSIIMIPTLTILFRFDQHLAQAAAMIANVAIAVPSFFQHLRAGAVRWDVTSRLLPAGIACVLVGVLASNRVHGEILHRIFGIFLIYIVFYKLRQMHALRSGADRPPPRVAWPVLSAVGGTTGFLAGLLGIGGGPVCVPLLQRFARLPLRPSIGGATALMSLTALCGAITKNATLGQVRDSLGEPLRVADSLHLATAMLPTALVGALIGAGLTHDLPLRWVRVAFLVLIAWAGALMLGFG